MNRGPATRGVIERPLRARARSRGRENPESLGDYGIEARRGVGGVAGSRVGMQLSRFALYLILPPKVSTCKSKVPPRISNNRISRRQIAFRGSCAVPRRFVRDGRNSCNSSDYAVLGYEEQTNSAMRAATEAIVLTYLH